MRYIAHVEQEIDAMIWTSVFYIDDNYYVHLFFQARSMITYFDGWSLCYHVSVNTVMQIRQVKF